MSLEPNQYSSKLIDEAQNTFSRDFGYEVSREQSEEMLSDLTGFFALLHEWDLKDKKQKESLKNGENHETSD